MDLILGGVCAVFVGSQVGPVCPHDSPFLMDVEGSLWFLLSFSLINWAMLFLINETRQSFCLVKKKFLSQHTYVCTIISHSLLNLSCPFRGCADFLNPV
jgi:hypothetical protein